MVKIMPRKKRIETVKHWCGSKNENAVFEIFENKPTHGFTISKEVRRLTTSNVVWRIFDPRGFELEISSGNMAYCKIWY